jgi:hypothetical protein
MPTPLSADLPDTYVTALSWNLANMGGRFRQWDAIAKLVRHLAPDLAFFQELHDFAAITAYHDQFAADISRPDLPSDMIMKVPPFKGTKISPGIAYRHSRFESLGYLTQDAHRLDNGFGELRLRPRPPLPDIPWTVASVHASPYSPLKAAAEVGFVRARISNPNGVGFFGGDVNYIAHGDPAPNLDIARAYNLAARAILVPEEIKPDGEVIPAHYVPNLLVADELLNASLTDVAGHLALQTGDNDKYRAPTGAGGSRVDQFWVTPPFVPAIVDYWVVDTELSDHKPIMFVLDTTKIAFDLARDYI